MRLKGTFVEMYIDIYTRSRQFLVDACTGRDGRLHP